MSFVNNPDQWVRDRIKAAQEAREWDPEQEKIECEVQDQEFIRRSKKAADQVCKVLHPPGLSEEELAAYHKDVHIAASAYTHLCLVQEEAQRILQVKHRNLLTVMSDGLTLPPGANPDPEFVIDLYNRLSSVPKPSPEFAKLFYDETTVAAMQKDTWVLERALWIASWTRVGDDVLALEKWIDRIRTRAVNAFLVFTRAAYDTTPRESKPVTLEQEILTEILFNKKLPLDPLPEEQRKPLTDPVVALLGEWAKKTPTQGEFTFADAMKLAAEIMPRVQPVTQTRFDALRPEIDVSTGAGFEAAGLALATGVITAAFAFFLIMALTKQRPDLDKGWVHNVFYAGSFGATVSMFVMGFLSAGTLTVSDEAVVEMVRNITTFIPRSQQQLAAVAAAYSANVVSGMFQVPQDWAPRKKIYDMFNGYVPESVINVFTGGFIANKIDFKAHVDEIYKNPFAAGINAIQTAAYYPILSDIPYLVGEFAKRTAHQHSLLQNMNDQIRDNINAAVNSTDASVIMKVTNATINMFAGEEIFDSSDVTDNSLASRIFYGIHYGVYGAKAEINKISDAIIRHKFMVLMKRLYPNLEREIAVLGLMIAAHTIMKAIVDRFNPSRLLKQKKDKRGTTLNEGIYAVLFGNASDFLNQEDLRVLPSLLRALSSEINIINVVVAGSVFTGVDPFYLSYLQYASMFVRAVRFGWFGRHLSWFQLASTLVNFYRFQPFMLAWGYTKIATTAYRGFGRTLEISDGKPVSDAMSLVNDIESLRALAYKTRNNTQISTKISEIEQGLEARFTDMIDSLRGDTSSTSALLAKLVLVKSKLLQQRTDIVGDVYGWADRRLRAKVQQFSNRWFPATRYVLMGGQVGGVLLNSSLNDLAKMYAVKWENGMTTFPTGTPSQTTILSHLLETRDLNNNTLALFWQRVLTSIRTYWSNPDIPTSKPYWEDVHQINIHLNVSQATYIGSCARENTLIPDIVNRLAVQEVWGKLAAAGATGRININLSDVLSKVDTPCAKLIKKHPSFKRFVVIYRARIEYISTWENNNSNGKDAMVRYQHMSQLNPDRPRWPMEVDSRLIAFFTELFSAMILSLDDASIGTSIITPDAAQWRQVLYIEVLQPILCYYNEPTRTNHQIFGILCDL